MHSLLGETLNNHQAELAQLDAVARKFRMICDDSQYIARSNVRIHAEQEVGCGKIKEAQRMRLNDLCIMHQLTQSLPSGRNAHRHNGVTRFCRGEKMAYRTDAANARRNARHLVKRMTFRELLESANLRDV